MECGGRRHRFGLGVRSCMECGGRARGLLWSSEIGVRLGVRETYVLTSNFYLRRVVLGGSGRHGPATYSNVCWLWIPRMQPLLKTSQRRSLVLFGFIGGVGYRVCFPL